MNRFVSRLMLAAVLAGPAAFTSAQTEPQPAPDPTPPASTPAPSPAVQVRIPVELGQAEARIKDLDRSTRELDLSKNPLDRVQVEVAQADATYPELRQELLVDGNVRHPTLDAGTTSNPLLVLSSESSDPKRAANLQEDLTVMSRILAKAIERVTGRDGKEAMGIFLSTWPMERRQQSVFLEEYGLLFLLEVPFPLIAPTATPAQAKGKASEDSAWEQTRRELFYGPGGPQQNYPFLKAQGSSLPYDSKRVESLKQELLESLLNAQNIRNLEPGNSIVVVVTGPEAVESGDQARYETRLQSIVRKERREAGGYGSGSAGGSYAPAGQVRTYIFKKPGSGQRRTTLVLRVRKSDVDAAANDKITVDEFKKKVSIQNY